jgi:predicted Zn-dependent peptidase
LALDFSLEISLYRVTIDCCMIFNKKVLSNGLRVLTIPMPSLESATVLVMAGAGSRYENRKNSGISHFLEHMAFKGTEKRRTAMDISSLIDGMGGEFNAFTGKETTGYYIKSSKDKIETSLDVLSDMLLHSKFDPTEIEKEKGVIIEEINLYEDMPARKIGDIYELLLYGDTPMGWDIAGNKDVIRSITRSDFLTYLGELYSASNLTVVVAGGIDQDKTYEKVEKYFGTMKQFTTKTFEPLHEVQSKPAVLVKQKQTEQIHIALGVTQAVSAFSAFGNSRWRDVLKTLS